MMNASRISFLMRSTPGALRSIEVPRIGDFDRFRALTSFAAVVKALDLASSSNSPYVKDGLISVLRYSNASLLVSLKFYLGVYSWPTDLRGLPMTLLTLRNSLAWLVLACCG